MNITFKDFEKQFHADGYRLGMKAVEAGLSDESMLTAVKELHDLVDEVIDHFSVFAKQHNQKPACIKGCHWCCHQPVFALSYELNYLNNFIQQNFNASVRKEIAQRSSEKRKRLKDLNRTDLLNSKFPCPLLSNGICMAYDARPVACRIYLSSDAGSCLNFYNQPDAEVIPALLYFPMQMGRMLNEGFRAALKAHGLQAAEYRIEEVVGEDTI